MRNLFVLLLLVNLVVAMWWLWIEPDQSRPASADAGRASTAKLVLVSELDVMLQSATPAGEVTGLALAVPAALDPSPSPGDTGGMPSADQVDAADGQRPVDAPATTMGPAVAGPGVAGPATVPSGGADGPLPADPSRPIGPASTAMDTSPADSRTSDRAGQTRLSGSSVAIPAAAEEPPAQLSPVAVADATPGVEPAAATPRCVSLGPFLNLREATVAASRLRTEGLEPRQRLARSQVWMGYWVHLPAFESRAAAVAAVDRLREQGIDDIYIEPAGPLRNTVSLGVFSDEARAQSHAATIRGLDVVVPAQVVERYRDDEVYWLDFELAADRPLDPQVYAPSSQTLRLEDPGCGGNR